MLGAIIGDIVGSQYEWKNNKKKDFTFFTGACHYTDDSLMTLAIAQAFTLRKGRWRDADFQEYVIEKMVEMGRAHQAASWGKHFFVSLPLRHRIVQGKLPLPQPLPLLCLPGGCVIPLSQGVRNI